MSMQDFSSLRSGLQCYFWLIRSIQALNAELADLVRPAWKVHEAVRYSFICNYDKL